MFPLLPHYLPSPRFLHWHHHQSHFKSYNFRRLSTISRLQSRQKTLLPLLLCRSNSSSSSSSASSSSPSPPPSSSPPPLSPLPARPKSKPTFLSYWAPVLKDSKVVKEAAAIVAARNLGLYGERQKKLGFRRNIKSQEEKEEELEKVLLDIQTEEVVGAESSVNPKSTSKEVVDPTVKKKKKNKKKKSKEGDQEMPITPEVGESAVTELEVVWPAPPEAVERAREFIKACAASTEPVLLLPDRDADGLCSGTIVNLALQILGKPPENIHVHFVGKGKSVFSPEEKEIIEKICDKKGIGWVIVLDQGSRGGGRLLKETGKSCNKGETVERKVLIIDHHWSEDFPEGATILSACNNPPVATSSLLTYHTCMNLAYGISYHTAWLAIVGTFGDLGSSTKFDPPFPTHLEPVLRFNTTKAITSLVSLLNAPRRTPKCNTLDAWSILQYNPRTIPQEHRPIPKKILAGDEDATTPAQRKALAKLQAASTAIKNETDKWAHVAPKFTSDGRLALLTIHSPYQIHPVIATRWAGYLGNQQNSKVIAVACANTGYIPEKVNFSTRRVKKKDVEVDVDLIALLKEYASKDEWVMQNVGEDFANGHKEATGGSLDKTVWEVFRSKGLEIEDRKKGEKATLAGKVGNAGQKNTLEVYFKKMKPDNVELAGDAVTPVDQKAEDEPGPTSEPEQTIEKDSNLGLEKVLEGIPDKSSTPKKGRGRLRKTSEVEVELEPEASLVSSPGRGRPRKKIETDVRDLEEAPKRGRGRPRKDENSQVSSSDLEEVPQRGRGRPRKEHAQVKSPDLEGAPKRGRGRPRKDENSQVSSSDLEEVPQRGRGRPRKEHSQLSSPDTETVPKRGRGRPRKVENSSPTSEAEISPPRGRGRPRKKVKVDDEEEEG